MTIEIKESKGEYSNLEKIECPHCNVVIKPISICEYNFHDPFNVLQDLAYAFASYSSIKEFREILQCPSCNSIFYASYTYVIHHDSNIGDYPECLNTIVYPQNLKNKKFSEIINEISSDFIEIYNQAYQAEQSGLTTICGVGYRKSIEFLVKDYAIKNNPNSKNKIENSNYTLSQCIKDFVIDSKIKNLATASTWIGNDETHYSKKHPNHNYEDMKNFIDIMIHYIELEESYKKAEQFLGDKAIPDNTD